MKKTLIIQAGGQSKRMGRNKALVKFQGQPLILRIIERVQSIADELLIITNNPEDYPFIEFPLIPDIFQGKGPLSGFYTAFHHASHPQVIILACDMPYVNIDLLNYQCRLLQKNYHAVVPHSQKGLEPLHGVYHKETCIHSIKEHLANEQLRLISWLKTINLCELTIEQVKKFDPTGRIFLNINNEHELKLAEKFE